MSTIGNLLVALCLLLPVAMADSYYKNNWLTKKEVKCLIDNLYYEALHEPYKGKKAVLEVVYNRSLKKNKNVCKIIHEPKQFSWTLKKRLERIAPKHRDELFHIVMKFHLNPTNYTNGATHYHAVYVSPKWNLDQTIQIGLHKFYR